MKNDRRITGRAALTALGAVVIAVIALVVVLSRSGANGSTYTLRLALTETPAAGRTDASQAACGTAAASRASGAAYRKSSGDTTSLRVAPGQLVPFQVLVEVAGDAPDNGTIDFQTSFPLATARIAGFDGERAVVCAFVDGSDPTTDEQTAATPATVTIAPLPVARDALRTRFSVSGLDPGETVVVEVWLVAPAGLPTETATLEATIDTAAARGQSIDIATKSARFRLAYFDRSEPPDLDLVVTDTAPAGSTQTNEVTYTIDITNTAKAALAPLGRLDAFIDPATRLVELTVDDEEGFKPKCDPTAGGFACALGFLNAGEKITVTARVAVAPNAERRWTKTDPGCQGAQYDICLQAVATWKRSATEDGTVRIEKPTDLPTEAKLTISKLAPRASFAYPGSTVAFTYAVTNTGAGALAKVRVSDSGCVDVKASVGDANANGLLDPGENWIFVCSVAQISEALATTDSRVDAVDNAGQAQTATARTRIELITPKLAVAVTTTGRDDKAREILVTNTGNAPLDNIAVATTNCSNVLRAPGETSTRLASGERWTFHCQPDSPASAVAARAYGTDPLDGPVTAASVKPAG